MNPSEEAKKLGLKHVGRGSYADKTGTIVARSIDGRLERIKELPGTDSTEKIAPRGNVDSRRYKSMMKRPKGLESNLKKVSSLLSSANYEKTIQKFSTLSTVKLHTLKEHLMEMLPHLVDASIRSVKDAHGDFRTLINLAENGHKKAKLAMTLIARTTLAIQAAINVLREKTNASSK
jgi:hypothetical protein